MQRINGIGVAAWLSLALAGCSHMPSTPNLPALSTTAASPKHYSVLGLPVGQEFFTFTYERCGSGDCPVSVGVRFVDGRCVAVAKDVVVVHDAGQKIQWTLTQFWYDHGYRIVKDGVVVEGNWLGDPDESTPSTDPEFVDGTLLETGKVYALTSKNRRKKLFGAVWISVCEAVW